MPIAISAGPAEKEKFTTTIELICSNEGPGGFPLGPFFFPLLSWDMGVGLYQGRPFLRRKGGLVFLGFVARLLVPPAPSPLARCPASEAECCTQHFIWGFSAHGRIQQIAVWPGFWGLKEPWSKAVQPGRIFRAAGIAARGGRGVPQG